MRESLNFVYNGISSEDMGVIIASPETGLFREKLLADKNIVEKTVTGNDKPYFERVERKPLSFPLTIFIHEWRNRDNLREIARWLDVDYYKKLTFESNPDRIYYAIFEGSSELMHNGAKDGYVTLNVRCNSPYTYSETATFDLKNNPIIINFGDKEIHPIFRIVNRVTNNTITITNETTNETMQISNLSNNESVFIDVANEDIVSSLQDIGVYRYSNLSGDEIRLVTDTIFTSGNTFQVTGSAGNDFDIEIEFQAIYLAD